MRASRSRRRSPPATTPPARCPTTRSWRRPRGAGYDHPLRPSAAPSRGPSPDTNSPCGLFVPGEGPDRRRSGAACKAHQRTGRAGSAVSAWIRPCPSGDLHFVAVVVDLLAEEAATLVSPQLRVDSALGE